MKQKIKNSIILIFFFILSFWTYPIVQGLWAAVYIPALKIFPRDLIRYNSCIYLTLAGSIGSIFCAFILSFPMGYFTQYRPFFMGALLGVSACLINFVTYPDLVFHFQRFIAIIRTGEYLSLILSSCLFSYMGFRMATFNHKYE